MFWRSPPGTDAPRETVSAPTHRGIWGDAALAVAVASVALAALLATSRDYAMVWDEGHTVRREMLLAEWFKRVSQADGPALRDLFSRNQLESFWQFSRREPDGHPPFYALLGLAGWWASRVLVDPLTAYRFGPMMLAAGTLGVLAYHLSRRYGRVAALTASGCLLTMPRVFAHAHYAHYDMPMACLWILAQIAFASGVRGRGPAWAWGLPFGIALGLSSGTKFTGWFAVVAPISWTIAAEGPAFLKRILGPPTRTTRSGPPNRGLRILAVGVPVAALVLVAIQPPWWNDPIAGVERFLQSNLTRSETKPIASLYWGEFYPFALPWHNTIVLTAVTVPVATLALATVGLMGSLTRIRTDGEGPLWVLNWAVLMVVRALPMTPGHDVERLLLPSMLSLAVLAGLGVAAIIRWGGDRPRSRIAAGLLGLIAVGEGVTGIAQLYPYSLSYYNAALGGLKGAERNGFELTYYWDTLGPEFLDWVADRDRASAEPPELRFPSNLVTLPYLRYWGLLPARLRIVPFDQAENPPYVVQRRKGLHMATEWWLEKNAKPIFTVHRQGVDLLRVYSPEDAFRAYSATRDEPTLPHLRETSARRP